MPAGLLRLLRSIYCTLHSDAPAPPDPLPISSLMRRTASGRALGGIQAKHSRKKPGSAAWQSLPGVRMT